MFRKYLSVAYIILSVIFYAGTLHAQTGSVKYVYLIDYPMGGKAAYLDWATSITSILQKPEELVSLAVYENYFNSSPNRVIEFEFDSMADCVKYFEMPEVKSIVDNSGGMSVNKRISVLKLSREYNKEGEK